jgi:cis-3-alkyl-4-acyloxetan-2-one decarboxylase
MIPASATSASRQTSRQTIGGVEVHIEGHLDADKPSTVLMLHGWPDTHHLWDATVDALKAQHRCIRFTLPGFDAHAPQPGASLSSMTALLLKIVHTLSPDQPVTLLIHDWGCFFGYEFATRHPMCVAKIVAVDIGDHSSKAFAKSLTAKAKWQILSYQVWLALAWKLGPIAPKLATGMTRWMARALRCQSDPERITWAMNYPYAMTWFGSLGGFKGAAQLGLLCPVLYLYGERKPFMFHSPEWLANLANTPGSGAIGFPTGHWVMLSDAPGFNATVAKWLMPAA